MNPGLVSCALPRMGGGDDAARKSRNPRISLGDFGGVAEVEHGRALVRPLLAFVEGTEQLVPGEIRDAEITAFVMEVMRHVARLHHGKRSVFRFVRQMLDAVAKYIKECRQQT